MENNRDLFKEAIADAKAVKEVSIANAKAALEEVITPRLKSMFEQKLTEMEEEEEKQEEGKDMKKEDSLEEEFNLEELLAELDEVEDEEVHEEEVTETVTESEEAIEEEAHEEKIHEEEETEEEEAEEADEDKADDSDVDIDFDNMTEDDLRAFIEEVVDEMIEAEELSLTDEEEDAEEAELEDEVEVEDEVEIEDEEVNIEDEIEDIELEEDATTHVEEMHDEKADSEDKLEEGQLNELTTPELIAMLPQIIGGFTALVGGTVGASVWLTKAEEGKYGDKWKAFAEKLSGAGGAASKVKEELEEVNNLKQELNEVNLLNSKLLYVNKILKESTLKESQKVKVITAFDKAETVKEVKLVYETLKESISKAPAKAATKKLVRESKNFASSTITGTSPVNKPVMEVDPMIARMKKLAGLT